MRNLILNVRVKYKTRLLCFFVTILWLNALHADWDSFDEMIKHPVFYEYMKRRSNRWILVNYLDDRFLFCQENLNLAYKECCRLSGIPDYFIAEGKKNHKSNFSKMFERAALTFDVENGEEEFIRFFLNMSKVSIMTRWKKHMLDFAQEHIPIPAKSNMSVVLVTEDKKTRANCRHKRVKIKFRHGKYRRFNCGRVHRGWYRPDSLDDGFNHLAQSFDSFLNELQYLSPNFLYILNAFMAAVLYSEQLKIDPSFSYINIDCIAVNMLKRTRELARVTTDDYESRIVLRDMLKFLVSPEEKSMFVARLCMLTRNKRDVFSESVNRWRECNGVTLDIHRFGVVGKVFHLSRVKEIWNRVEPFKGVKLTVKVNGIIKRKMAEVKTRSLANQVWLPADKQEKLLSEIFEVTKNNQRDTTLADFLYRFARNDSPEKLLYAQIIGKIAASLQVPGWWESDDSVGLTRLYPLPFSPHSESGEYITPESMTYLKYMIKSFSPIDQLTIALFTFGKLHPESERFAGLDNVSR